MGNVTSVLQPFRPTVLPSYDTIWTYCNIESTTAVGRMYILFCYSDLYAGTADLVSMYIDSANMRISRRSDDNIGG